MQTLQNLITELTNLQNLEDKRLSILVLFLYAEHYAMQLCSDNNIENSYIFICDSCGEETGRRQLSLPEKITKLIENEILDEELLEPFNLLNKIRNKLIHNLSPDNEMIINWIDEYTPPTNSAVEQLLNNENSWVKFYLCLVPAIANLYNKISGTDSHLQSIEKNIPTAKWIFHFA